MLLEKLRYTLPEINNHYCDYRTNCEDFKGVVNRAVHFHFRWQWAPL